MVTEASQDPELERDVQWLAAVLPAPEQLAALTRGDPARALLGAAKQRAPIETGYQGDPGSDPEIRAQFAIALAAAAKLKQSPYPQLAAAEVQALHAFGHLVARPAIRVLDGSVAGIPEPWKRLRTDVEKVAELIRGIGRIDAPGRQHVGTGWLVAPGLLLTNKHVVGQLCGLDVHHDLDWKAKVGAQVPVHNALWAQQPAARPAWDPGESPSSTDPAPGAITRIREVHPQLDMALLEVEGVANSENLVLPLSATGPRSSTRHDIYVAGYPAVHTGYGLHPALAKLLFAGAHSSGLKRVSPGQLVELVEPLPVGPDRPCESHDASTLGGSSGSPVIDLDNHCVVALHHSGRYGRANYAVPLWLVKDDPFFTAHGIVFRA